MMSGVPLETCRAFNKRWNNKFYYKVASCWLFLLKENSVIEDYGLLDSEAMSLMAVSDAFEGPSITVSQSSRQ